MNLGSKQWKKEEIQNTRNGEMVIYILYIYIYIIYIYIYIHDTKSAQISQKQNMYPIIFNNYRSFVNSVLQLVRSYAVMVFTNVKVATVKLRKTRSLAI